MSARNVFINAAGQGGLAAERALTENADQIQSFVMRAQGREFRNEATLGFSGPSAPSL